MADLLDKTLKYCHKDAPRTKGRHEVRRVIQEQCKEINIERGNEKENLEFNSTVAEMENPLEGFISKFEQAEERSENMKIRHLK